MAELTCTDFATWHLLPAPNCQVYKPKVDVLVVYCSSLILLDTIFIPTRTLLKLGASCLLDDCWKPWCVAVTGSVLIIPLLQCNVALTSIPSQLNSKHHWSVWEWHVGQVFLPHLYFIVSMCKLFAWGQLAIVINKTEKSHKDKHVCMCTHTVPTVWTDTLKNYSRVYNRMKAWTVSWFECVNVADMHNRPNGVNYST